MKKELKEYFKGKNCLVTGGTGLIGRAIVDKLVNYGASVFVASLDGLTPNKKVVYYSPGGSDLCNFRNCIAMTRGMHCVFHLAGIKGSVKMTTEKPASFFVPLLQMNTNILEAARFQGVKKLVYTSSIGAYPQGNLETFTELDNSYYHSPLDYYPGWAKRMAEMQIIAYNEQYGLEYSIVRPSNIFGKGDNFNPQTAMVIPSLISKIFNTNKTIKVWGDGSAIRDFLYAKDCANGIIQALYYGTWNTPNHFVNLGCGKGYSIKQLVETLNEIIPFNYKFDKSKPSGYPKRILDISNAKEYIQFKPQYSLKKALIETIDWYQDHKDEYLKRKDYLK